MTPILTFIASHLWQSVRLRKGIFHDGFVVPHDHVPFIIDDIILACLELALSGNMLRRNTRYVEYVRDSRIVDPMEQQPRLSSMKCNEAIINDSGIAGDRCYVLSANHLEVCQFVERKEKDKKSSSLLFHRFAVLNSCSQSPLASILLHQSLGRGYCTNNTLNQHHKHTKWRIYGWEEENGETTPTQSQLERGNCNSNQRKRTNKKNKPMSHYPEDILAPPFVTTTLDHR